MQGHLTPTISINTDIIKGGIIDYTEILNTYGLNYISDGIYLQVGEIKIVQGWILHVSVIISQAQKLLTEIIPFLISENVAFKIPINKEVCQNLLLGHLGINQMGKVVCIYPTEETHALFMAEKLIQLTSSYNGPSILTDVLLGNSVYTRYGSFNPILISNPDGKVEKYIYNSDGDLNKDIYNIPFQIPKGIQWPYESIASPEFPKETSILKQLYKPTSILKKDIKGFVFKGLYLKSLFKVSKCVIKQGIKHMTSDNFGRDIRDRLFWQQELYNELKDEIPLAKILDVFTESNGNTYLVMEFIEGHSLYSTRKKGESDSKSWLALDVSENHRLLKSLISICSILEKLHKKGYVHRDVAPGNFLITKKDEIYLIDLELAYSFHKCTPTPPFAHGTPGFMSPRQIREEVPDIQDDIYGFGSLMISVMTGINPIRLDSNDSNSLINNLNFFIENIDIATLIAECLKIDPAQRPDTTKIKEKLIAYKNGFCKKKNISGAKSQSFKVKEIVDSSVKGLISRPTILLDGLWYSNTNSNRQFEALEYKEFSKSPAMYDGISGILYVLSRIKSAGINIDVTLDSYNKGWQYLEEEYINFLPRIPPGLYGGAAGIASSLVAGIHANLIEDHEAVRRKIKSCLELDNNDLSQANGIVGQGISTMSCMALFGKDDYLDLLNKYISILLDFQEEDGSWILNDNQSGILAKSCSFSYGIPGIIHFLLESMRYTSDQRVSQAVLKSLRWLTKRTNNLKDLFHPKNFIKKILTGMERGDERKGIILTAIKAYEVLGIDSYKQYAEEALLKYPEIIIKNDFSQNSGLAGLGELYLEAFRVLKNRTWQTRADWITNLFVHTFIKNTDGSGYWRMSENNDPTADFMVGTSGIVHFLVRYLYPEKVGYRLLN